MKSFNGYKIILNDIELLKLIKKLEKVSLFSLNIIADTFDKISIDLVGFSFAIENELAIYLPIKHDYLGVPKQISLNKVLNFIKPIFENKKILKVVQNLKYNLFILKKYDINLCGVKFDTMLESYVLNSFLGSHDLNSISNRWLKSSFSFFNKKNKDNKNIFFLKKIILKKLENMQQNMLKFCSIHILKCGQKLKNIKVL